MATEEQTQHNTIAGLDGTDERRAGQKLTISSRVVSKLAFKLIQVGSPTGNVTFTIRKLSTDIISSKVWGDASSLPTSYPATEWQEVTFDTPQLVNEEVWIFCEFAGGDSQNQVALALQSEDVKADEHLYLISFGNVFDSDATYRYTYEVGVAPTVTTQATTDIVATTATGNGNVTDLGDEAVTQHGHCWNTTGTPDTDDSKTENGAKATTGAFTSSITGLILATTYYVRAYATNTFGTSYGTSVTFLAGASGLGELSGLIAVVETRLHYVDAYGVERYGEGILV